ncbi:MAG: bifunctional riboflavin kinase/FAD synthetase [Acidimicrobiia bacterium]|nr:bifunctional riboflavin kinase/FAD synthetase [Acidimicrobiia bacterium]
MRVLEGDYQIWDPLPGPSAVTIGVYDGVHLGHQQVLRALEAFGLPVVVVTFRGHPELVIDPDAAPSLLMPVERRLDLLEEYGVAAVALIDFDEDFRRLAADEFVDRVLVAKLQARRVAVGSGFRFGYRQLGDVALLRKLGGQHGFAVDDVAILEEGVPVRSTVIRALVGEGHVDAAARLLGRPFRLVGRVVPGDQRGRTIGYPTANLEVGEGLVVPGSGVYAARTRHGEDAYLGVVNVGNRPTFGGEESVVEAHLLDYRGDLYGSELEIDFVARLRAEQKFPGIEELIEAIANDVHWTRQLLEA